MKNLLTLAMAVSAFSVSAQVVTTNPEVITESSKNIVITFHADWGTAGLAGSPSTTEVYAHTGVITDSSESPADWKFSPDWGDNSPKYKLTNAGTNLWTLTIPSINEYYGITDSSVKVKELAFVFRNSNGTKEGKAINGNDILVTVFPTGYPAPKQQSYPGGTPRMGAVDNGDGTVTFCLAAPGKNAVSLMGSWNGYALTADSQMNYHDYNGTRYFWTTVSGIADGKDHPYYYLIDGQTAVGDPYANLVLDPWNDQYISSSVFPDMPAYPTKEVSGVPVAVYNSSANDYKWEHTDFKGVAQSDLLIYELLIRDFTGTEGKANAEGTVEGVISKLDYIKELGVNAVELLPIMEFNGNDSWGYNTNFYFAPDKAYGTPDDYRRLVDECHSRGLAVILDIVFNQTDGLHPWYMMYPRVLNPFYNGSAPHSYSVLNDWNQDNALVQQQFKDALKYWLESYNVDGFRFDLVKGLGANDSYGNTYNADTNTWGTPNESYTNRYNATRVARMKELHDAIRTVRPDAYFINENLATAEEENDMAKDGEINWANINDASCQFAMGYEDNSSLNRFYAPLDSRTWGSTVSYAESHDEERMAYKQTKWGIAGVKGNEVISMRRLATVAAQMLMTPGAHMIWQFQEFGADQTTKNDYGNDTSAKKVIWSYLNNPLRASLCKSYRELLAIRGDYPEMFRQDVEATVQLDQWTGGRTVTLSRDNGEKMIVLVVNPQVTGNLTVPTSVDLTSDKFRLLSVSSGVTPSPVATGVGLSAGAYAVYGTTNLASVDGITADGSANSELRLTVANGEITAEGVDSADLRVFTPAGTNVAPRGLTPGIYIVTAPGFNAAKVAVR